MVLLIPRTVRSIMAKGHAEGRKEEQKRMISVLRAARSRGIDPDSPEFEQFLLGFDVDQPDDSR